MKLKDLFAVHVIAFLFILAVWFTLINVDSPYGCKTKLLIFGGMSIFIYDLSVVLWKMIDHLDE